MDKKLEDLSFNNIKTRKRDKTYNDNNCQELKNIEYKTLLINGNSITCSVDDTSNNCIDVMLSRESNLTKKILWNKIDKTNKIVIFKKFVEKQGKHYSLNDNEKDRFLKYLIDCIDRKMLLKIKDVTYDKDIGEIIDIPNLVFNENTRNFNIKKSEKHVSSLRSLAPTKNKTIKNI